ncbi:MAG: hypothetical protein FJ109_07705 [Deltaproteobacteria bacterium]|nr:hypothetical protein [Deltaproteobacteria bacterium]
MRRSDWILSWGATVVLLTGILGCRKEEPRPFARLLDEQRKALVATDYGEAFDQSMAVVDELATQKQDVNVGVEAILLRSRVHLDLLVAALLTDDPALYEKLKLRLSWRLERPLTDPRNLQLLAQDLLETFRLVVRESKDRAEVRGQAQALALFADGIQGILFRNKSRYFEGRTAVAALPELRYLDDLMCVRDLTHECLRRNGAPAGNWQYITLTVVGRVCPDAAAKYLDRLCSTPAALADPARDEYCTTDFEVLPIEMRKDAGKFLQGACRLPTVGVGAGGTAARSGAAGGSSQAGAAAGTVPAAEGSSATGLAVVRAFYEEAFARLEKEADTLPGPTRDAVRKLSVDKDAALKGVDMLFTGVIQ